MSAIDDLTEKFASTIDPASIPTESVMEEIVSIAGSMNESVEKLDALLRSKVVVSLPAHSGWRWVEATDAGIAVHPVKSWGLIGPCELPEWCKMNISCMPIDERTHEVVSFMGFQGIFGPDEGTDEEICKKVEQAVLERTAAVFEQLAAQNEFEEKFEATKKQMEALRESMKNKE